MSCWYESGDDSIAWPPNVFSHRALLHFSALESVFFLALASAQLDALVAVAHGIPALYHAEHPGDGSSQLGADDFLPIFIYVFVNSEVEGMVSLAVVLETLCDPKKMMGEAGELEHDEIRHSEQVMIMKGVMVAVGSARGGR